MKIKGHIIDFDFNFIEEKHYISIAIDSGNIEEINNLTNRNLTIDIKELEKAKTPSQNRFFWEIVTKIANHKNVMSTKEEVYQHMLMHYGEPIAELKAPKVIDQGDMDIHYILQKKGRKYNHYLVVKGISLMTSKEMTTFIEHAINEAKELGIDTTPPYEWERLKRLWEQSR